MENQRNTAELKQQEEQGVVKVDLECVRAFMREVWPKNGQMEYWQEIWRRLLAHLPLVELADTQHGEWACFAAVTRDPLTWPAKRATPEFFPHEQGALCECVRELCAYLPEMRGPILRAALDEADRLIALHRVFDGRRTERIFRRAIRGLAPREKALLHVLRVLDMVGGDRDVDFANIWPDLVWNTPLDVLRQEPSLKDLMNLFDQADELLDRENW